MVTAARHLLWRVPLTVLACVASSLAIVWVVSRVMGLTLNPTVVAVLSAVLSAAAIAAELRGRGKGAKGTSA